MSKEQSKDRIIGFIQLVVVAAFIVASIMISMALNKKEPPAQETTAQERVLIVRSQDITPKTHLITFQTTGVTRVPTEIQVSPQVSGNVINVNENFYAGGHFKAEEILFEIEPIDYELEIKRLGAQVSQAQTAYNLAKAEAEAAIAEWKMFNPDKPAPSLVARKPQMNEARANLRAARAQLENADLDLKRTKISMPFDGRVLSATIAPGQFVQAGQSYGSVFDPAMLEVEMSLDAQQLEWLRASQNAGVALRLEHGGDSHELSGFVKRGASTLDPATRFAKVAIGLNAAPTTLIPGIFADIAVAGPTLTGVSEIPANAIQNGGIVWQITADNTLSALQPEIIQMRENYALAKGINANTKIVIGKLNGATQGTKVRVEGE